MPAGRAARRTKLVQIEPLEDRRLMSVVAMLYAGPDVDLSASDGDPASATILKTAIEGLGNTVKTFDMSDSNSVAAALQGADMVVFPELIGTGLVTTRQYHSEALIRNFLEAGGGLMFLGSDSLGSSFFIRGLLGYSNLIVGTGPDVAAKTSQATGTQFASA